VPDCRFLVSSDDLLRYGTETLTLIHHQVPYRMFTTLSSLLPLSPDFPLRLILPLLHSTSAPRFARKCFNSATADTQYRAVIPQVIFCESLAYCTLHIAQNKNASSSAVVPALTRPPTSSSPAASPTITLPRASILS
jgi:hypothetical protein